MNCAILVAAGQGTRMGPNIDKLFLEVAGRPVVAHTWRRFDEADLIDEIIVVIRESLRPAFADLARALKPRKPFRFVLGGMERQDSVWNGLEALPASAELVAIQDAARPCTSLGLIRATLDAAGVSAAAVAARPVTDTIKASDDGKIIARHLDRSKLWAVETPQCFQVPLIRRAFAAVRERKLVVTDDTAACDLIGQPVVLVPSLEPNPKVTVPSDLPYIELLLRAGTAGAAPQPGDRGRSGGSR